jgi:hypothetical protein
MKLLKKIIPVLPTFTEIDLLNKELLHKNTMMNKPKLNMKEWNKPMSPPEETLLISENGKPNNGKQLVNLPDLDLLKILLSLLKHYNKLEPN